MRVRRKLSDDWAVEGPKTLFDKTASLVRPTLGKLLMGFQKPVEAGEYSGNWIPSFWSKAINASSASIVHLHWVGGDALSIEDIGHICKPIVWTLHDMWPFCGTGHCAADEQNARWRQGYYKLNRGSAMNGIDMDTLVWRRKQRAWRNPMHLTAPSRWLAECTQASALFHNQQVSVIPNVLDTSVYHPLDQSFCRDALGLSLNEKIILFGAIRWRRDQNKGYDLLIKALKDLASYGKPYNLELLVFGQSEPRHTPALPFPTRWMGHVHDDTTLSLLYNAADVMVVPSRRENLPQTATEAQSCGCPVVAFKTSGFLDAVAHRESGYLARAYEPEDMAAGIRWILDSKDVHASLSLAARKRALRLWAPEVVVPQYLALYRSLAEGRTESPKC